MTDVNDAIYSDDPVPLRIEQLWIYPVKSCAGIRLQQAELQDSGLAWDRAWMVIDEDGEFVSQRELPRMALVRPAFHLGQLELSAPGMLSLHLGLEAAGETRRVRVWDDEVVAFDMGDAAAQWFSDFLLPETSGAAPRLRVVRFDPAQRRLSSARWTGGIEATNQFSDGFPVLVLSSASLAELNERLAALDQPVVGIERFRPNLVLGGLEAHDEDRLAELVFALGAGAEVRLQPVKPCARCSIPDIDPATAQSGSAVRDTLQTYRQDRRLLGALTFGMNAIVRAGAGRVLSEGLAGAGRWDAWDE